MTLKKQDLCLISLGSNLADTAEEKFETLSVALRLLEEKSVEIAALSRFYLTPAFPPGSGPEFVNAAAQCGTSLTPEAFLSALHEVEDELGRLRPSRWAARSCDLDLLAWGDLVSPDIKTVETWIDLPLEAQNKEAPRLLILPHPRIQDRGFVLKPLADIAAEWRHPVLGKTVREMLGAIPNGELNEIREYRPDSA